jgi:hypothetical protein
LNIRTNVARFATHKRGDDPLTKHSQQRVLAISDRQTHSTALKKEDVMRRD